MMFKKIQNYVTAIYMKWLRKNIKINNEYETMNMKSENRNWLKWNWMNLILAMKDKKNICLHAGKNY